MEYRVFEDTCVIRVDKGQELISCIKEVCKKENILAGQITGIGAAGEIECGCFDPIKKEFIGNEYKGDFEIASLVGSVTEQNGEPYIHLHITFAGAEDPHAIGGHLARAVISLTGEIIITKIKGKIDRNYLPEVGLNLFKFD